MTFLEYFTPHIAIAVGCLLLGYLRGRASRRQEFAREAYPLEFLEANGYSLQCVRGINGDDDTWGVTDSQRKLVSLPCFTPREAVDSAIGHAAFLSQGAES